MEPVSPPPSITATAPIPERPRPLLLWRLLALAYDLWPALALWMLVASVFTVAYTVLGHHAERENIPPFSSWQWLLWLACWLITGVYATLSWRRGGQTLGMRPWRLRLQDTGSAPRWAQLWIRYVVGSLSLLAGGLGFWWALIDPTRQTWHDRASGLRLERMAKAAKRE